MCKVLVNQGEGLPLMRELSAKLTEGEKQYKI